MDEKYTEEEREQVLMCLEGIVPFKDCKSCTYLNKLCGGKLHQKVDEIKRSKSVF